MLPIAHGPTWIQTVSLDNIGDQLNVWLDRGKQVLGELTLVDLGVKGATPDALTEVVGSLVDHECSWDMDNL